MTHLKVPVEIGGFKGERTADGWQVCGYVEVPGIGRVPVCKQFSDEEAMNFLKKGVEDVKGEAERFKRRGGFRGWWNRYFGGKK